MFTGLWQHVPAAAGKLGRNIWGASHLSPKVRSGQRKEDLSIQPYLLTSLLREQAAAYCKDIQKVEGYQAWIIGIVEKGNRLVFMREKERQN